MEAKDFLEKIKSWSIDELQRARATLGTWLARETAKLAEGEEGEEEEEVLRRLFAYAAAELYINYCILKDSRYMELAEKCYENCDAECFERIAEDIVMAYGVK